VLKIDRTSLVVLLVILMSLTLVQINIKMLIITAAIFINLAIVIGQKFVLCFENLVAG
jgi:hypothetical protein